MSDSDQKLADRADPINETAAAEQAASSTSGGWTSWYTQAKSKAISTFSMVKKDLTELGETVNQQAFATIDAVANQAPIVSQTAQDIGSKAGGWVKSLASTVNDLVLQISDTTSDEELNQVPIVVGANDPNSPRRSASFAAAKLVAIQSDPNTFLAEAGGAPELFEDWLDHFSLADKKPEILDLLAKNDVMKRIYTELVPSTIKSSVFWERYFYKVHQFELDQTKLQTFLQRHGSDSILSATATVDSHDSWGDDTDFDELTTVIKEKGLYESSGVTVPHDLDEKTTTALLAEEDAAQQNLKIPPEPMTLSDTKTESSLGGAAVASPILADEVCSENSFCVVNSGYSSDNGENLNANEAP